jgi:hypothetical protein
MQQTPSMPEKFVELLAHWRALRGEAPAPRLADFLDKPLPGLQPWIVIFDAEGDMPLRLLGTAMADFYGRDLTGKACHEVYAPDTVPGVRAMHVQIAKSLCGCIAPSVGQTSTGRTPALYSLGLPLLRKDGISIVWLVEPAVPLRLGETGMPVRRLAPLQWIDLGNGVPG